MSNKIRLAKSIKALGINLLQVYEETLNECKLGVINSEEKKAFLDIIEKIAYPLSDDIVDQSEIIEEQRKRIENLERKLLEQEYFELDTDECRNRVKAIVKKNEELEAEINSLKNKIQLIITEEPSDTKLRQAKPTYIAELVSLNNKLETENQQLLLRLGELNELEKLGQKMKEQQQKGRKQNKHIQDSEIKKLHDLGLKPYQIFKTLQEEGRICTLQTIINRLRKMGIPKGE